MVILNIHLKPATDLYLFYGNIFKIGEIGSKTIC